STAFMVVLVICVICFIVGFILLYFGKGSQTYEIDNKGLYVPSVLNLPSEQGYFVKDINNNNSIIDSMNDPKNQIEIKAIPKAQDVSKTITNPVANPNSVTNSVTKSSPVTSPATSTKRKLTLVH